MLLLLMYRLLLLSLLLLLLSLQKGKTIRMHLREVRRLCLVRVLIHGVLRLTQALTRVRMRLLLSVRVRRRR